jgi:microsomal dipeptidase-like Zn-dependent dipeptidase
MINRRTAMAGALGAAGLAALPSVAGCGPTGQPTLYGIADVHFHLASHLGFGGKLFAGQPDHPDGLAGALPDCSGPHGVGGTGLTGSNAPILSWVEATGFGAGIGHMTNGFPKYDGHPRFTSTIHQQGFVEWIRRAHAAGLSLMVALAVNNRLLADLYGVASEAPVEDVPVVRDQVAYTKEFVARHSDFMEIAYSPADARRIIGAKRLAVVLGVEVDQLGGFADGVSENAVETYLDHLYQIGIRHIFPIHLADNAFGGSALYHGDVFWALQLHLNGVPFDVVDGGPDVEFRFGSVLPALLNFLARGGAVDSRSPEQIPGSHTNARGLTGLGGAVVKAMMRRQFVIDVDHMSQRTLRGTLELAEAKRYPVISGHTGFRSLAWSLAAGETDAVAKTASETLKTDADLERIRRVGGMVAPQLLQGDVKPAHLVDPSITDRGIADCAGSSTSFAQAYLYAVRKMAGRGVGFGSDCNGFAQFPGPRFGPNAAYHLHSGQVQDTVRRGLRQEQIHAQHNPVRYDSPNSDWRRYRWSEGVALDDSPLRDQWADLWQAVGVIRSDCDPWTDQAPTGQPMEDVSGRARDLAKGIFAGRPDTAARAGALDHGNTAQRVGFLLGSGSPPDPADSADVLRLYNEVRSVWEQATRLDTGKNQPISRCFANNRDYDINIDGFAHYGLLPDFLQDLRNIGLSDADLAPLYASAEEYVQLWERCTGERPPFDG